MKKIILTVSLAAFVAAAFAAETTPADKTQPACTNKAKASCPTKTSCPTKAKAKAGCSEKNNKAKCSHNKAAVEKKSADAATK